MKPAEVEEILDGCNQSRREERSWGSKVASKSG